MRIRICDVSLGYQITSISFLACVHRPEWCGDGKNMAWKYWHSKRPDYFCSHMNVFIYHVVTLGIEFQPQWYLGELKTIKTKLTKYKISRGYWVCKNSRSHGLRSFGSGSVWVTFWSGSPTGNSYHFLNCMTKRSDSARVLFMACSRDFNVSEIWSKVLPW